MPRKPARTEKMELRVDEDLLPDLNIYPSQVRRFYTDNVLEPRLAYLVGFTDTRKAVMLRATATGLLKVSSFPPVFSRYYVNPTSNVVGFNTISGTAIITEAFPETVTRVDIYSKDADIYVELSNDGVVWGPKILVQGSLNQVMSIDFEAKAVRFSNVVTDGTANGSYQVVGYA